MLLFKCRKISTFCAAKSLSSNVFLVSSFCWCLAGAALYHPHNSDLAQQHRMMIKLFLQQKTHQWNTNDAKYSAPFFKELYPWCSVGLGLLQLSDSFSLPLTSFNSFLNTWMRIVNQTDDWDSTEWGKHVMTKTKTVLIKLRVLFPREQTLYKNFPNRLRLEHAERPPTTTAHLTAIPLELFCPHWPCGEHYALPCTLNHTHTRQISLFLPLSQPPTLSQGTSVWLLCAIFWCDILSCARILYSLCMCATRCVCGGFLVWRGANALGLREDSSVLLMEAGWKFLSLATTWSGQAETGRERQRSHSSSSTIVSCQQLQQKVLK